MSIVKFTAATATVSTSWTHPAPIDAIIIADCTAMNIQATLNNQGLNAKTYDFVPLSRGIQILLIDAFHATSLSLSLSGMPADDARIGKAYAGPVLELPRFAWGGVGAGLNVKSKAERTMGGQVYGVKKPTYGSFSASWERLDNDVRLKLEAYANAVQFSEPHFIEPYYVDEYPPMYAALSKFGEFTKRTDAPWKWDWSAAWEEAL